jgi:hypothetical protein
VAGEGVVDAVVVEHRTGHSSRKTIKGDVYRPRNGRGRPRNGRVTVRSGGPYHEVAGEGVVDAVVVEDLPHPGLAIVGSSR